MAHDLLADYLALGASMDALYSLDEPSGATMNDRSGNARNGVYNGAPTLGATGIDLDSATAMTLANNVANYGSVAQAAWMERTTTIAIAIWFKTTSAGNQYMLQRWESTGATQCWGLDLQTSDVIRYYVQAGGGNNIVSLTYKNLRDGQWHLAAMEYDGTNHDLIVDGRLVQRSTGASGALNSTSGNSIGIGRRLATAGSGFDGSLSKAYIGAPIGADKWLRIYQAGIRKRTRWWLPASTTQALTPAYHTATWDVTASAARRLMVLEKTNVALAGTSVSDTATTGVEDVLHRQFIATNNPFTRKGILSGTFSFVQRPVEANAAADAMMQVVIKVVDPSGTIRGSVAYAGQTATTVVATAGAMNQENATGNASRYWKDIALTDTPYEAGDFLVVELGHRTVNATATIYSGAIRMGDPTNTIEHMLSDGDVSDRVPWIEFSQDLPVVPQDGWGIAA